jgi:CHASE2 domain-containing sensor protein
MGEFSLFHWLIFVILVSPIVAGVLLLGLQKPVRIVHGDSGLVKTGYIGYSWTYLIFGWFVPLIRGELGTAVLHLVITLVSAGLSQLIFPFIYNRQYMNRMLTSGWRLDTSDANYELAKQVLGVRSEPHTL